MCVKHFAIPTVVMAVLGVVSSPRVTFAQAADAAPQERSLAERARDPTSPLVAFQITYKSVDFYQLPSDANQGSLILQPIIPFRIGNQAHIARATATFVTNGPDFGAIAAAPPGLAPPNQIPLGDKRGFQDLAMVDLLIFPAPFGRWGLGPALVLPTASDPSLGSGKWSLGPAFVLTTALGRFQGGFLLQGIFSVAGKEDRDDLDVISLQPFGGIGLKNDWSIGLSDIVFTYDTRRGTFTSVPFGLRLEKFLALGKLPARVYGDVEYGFLKNDLSPKWTSRFTFTPLL